MQYNFDKVDAWLESVYAEKTEHYGALAVAGYISKDRTGRKKMIDAIYTATVKEMANTDALPPSDLQSQGGDWNVIRMYADPSVASYKESMRPTIPFYNGVRSFDPFGSMSASAYDGKYWGFAMNAIAALALTRQLPYRILSESGGVYGPTVPAQQQESVVNVDPTAIVSKYGWPTILIALAFMGAAFAGFKSVLKKGKRKKRRKR